MRLCRNNHAVSRRQCVDCQHIKEEVNQEVLNEVEKKMADYVIMQDKLNVTWRKLMSIK